jgi:hypothetical protein
MNIGEREQQTLEAIGDELARSAPKLASMLAMFSRLTADEAMPPRRPLRRAARGLGTGAWRVRWRWAWLVAAAALLALALIFSHGPASSSTCTASPSTACGPVHIHPGAGRGS